MHICSSPTYMTNISQWTIKLLWPSHNDCCSNNAVLKLDGRGGGECTHCNIYIWRCLFDKKLRKKYIQAVKRTAIRWAFTGNRNKYHAVTVLRLKKKDLFIASHLNWRSFVFRGGKRGWPDKNVISASDKINRKKKSPCDQMATPVLCLYASIVHPRTVCYKRNKSIAK